MFVLLLLLLLCCLYSLESTLGQLLLFLNVLYKYNWLDLTWVDEGQETWEDANGERNKDDDIDDDDVNYEDDA